MSIPFTPGSFQPPVGPYQKYENFYLWVQKTLPTIYDDTLSYQELLAKVLYQLNLIGEQGNQITEDVTALNTAYGELQDWANENIGELVSFVNDYFDNLDVQQEINNKLDAMAQDGSLSALLGPIAATEIPGAVSDWLETHITAAAEGQTIIVDNSLSIDGAAADAAATGTAVNNVKTSVKNQISKWFTEYRGVITFTQGAVSSTTGEPTATQSTRIKSNDYAVANHALITVEPGYKFVVHVYNSGDVYLGYYNGDTYSIGMSPAPWKTDYILLANLQKEYKIRIVVATENDGSITPTTGSDKITVFENTDTHLVNNGGIADALSTRNYVDRLGNILGTKTENIWSGELEYNYTGYATIILPYDIPAGTYTILMDVESNDTTHCLIYGYSEKRLVSDTIIVNEDIGVGTGRRATFTTTDPIKVLRFIAGTSFSDATGKAERVSNILLSVGSYTGNYIPIYSATDSIAREKTSYMIASTNDTTDRKNEIEAILNSKGICQLGEGTFYVSGIVMPDGSTLCGVGSESVIEYLGGLNDCITMGDKSTVKDLSIYGASEDITLSSDFLGVTTENTSENLWGNGDISITTLGRIQLALTTPLTPGFYRITAEVTTSASTGSFIGFSTSDNPSSISGDSFAGSALMPRDGRKTEFLKITKNVYTVRLCSSTSVGTSDGISATWNNIRITRITGNSGIFWGGENKQYGIVENCRIKRFNCAGIIAQDTGTPTNKNLAVSNCFIENCNAGIFIRKNSEFNKIDNCTLTWNYYGYYNRGGNNNISNCGIDRNKINCQIDMDEGSNNGHGVICGCSLNHAEDNSGYSLIIKNTGRMLITGCNFYYGKILLDTTNGNIINSCGFGSSAGWEINNGDCNLFSTCMVRDWGSTSTPVTITNNTKTQIINCFDRSGNTYMP